MSSPTIMMTGGGTGGHVFPMIAVADALRRHHPGLEVVFVGTERGIETRIVPGHGYKLELLKSEPALGGRWLGLVRGVWKAAANVPMARQLVRQYDPRVVFSLGGYAAVSVSLAARLLGKPIALMEPNSVVGLANRALMPLVARAYTAFDSATARFKASIVRETGVALRRGFEPRPFGYRGGRLRVLVLGGSQGAKMLNDTVPHALARAKVPVQVVHQTGHGRDADVRGAYVRLGAGPSSEVVAFIDDMPEQLGRADLVIARAGAGQVAEIAAVGRPSILVPYPHAAGDHQLKNALLVQRAGAALCLPEERATAPELARLIDELAGDPARLMKMADAARGWGRPDAADVVAADLLSLAGLDSAGAGSPRSNGSPSNGRGAVKHGRAYPVGVAPKN